MRIKEKVAYLSGLMDGLELDENSKEGKVFNAILRVLDEVADEMDILSEELNDLRDFADALDEDMEEIEELLDLDDEFDDDDDDDDEKLRLRCPVCGYVNTVEPEAFWAAEDEVEILCSNCNNVLFSSDDEDDNEEDDDDDL